MTHADIVHRYDQQQSHADTARCCPLDDSHGRLTTHASGTALICAHIIRREGLAKFDICPYTEPTSAIG